MINKKVDVKTLFVSLAIVFIFIGGFGVYTFKMETAKIALENNPTPSIASSVEHTISYKEARVYNYRAKDYGQISEWTNIKGRFKELSWDEVLTIPVISFLLSYLVSVVAWVVIVIALRNANFGVLAGILVFPCAFISCTISSFLGGDGGGDKILFPVLTIIQTWCMWPVVIILLPAIGVICLIVNTCKK